MKNRKEKGITLITLVITIIVLITLVAVGAYSSTSSVQSSKYDVFTAELKVIQSKVNQITEEYQKENKQIGVELTTENQRILNTTEVTTQLTKKAQDAGCTIDEIKNGFKLCTKDYIKQTLGIENITRDYLVNMQQCIVVSAKVFEYEGTNYYMLEQMDNGLYNVTYKNQIDTTGDFTVKTSNTGEKYKVTITPKHQKYVSKWQVKYRVQGSTHWNTINDLVFIVDKAGTYEIQVIHGEQVNLGTKTVTIE